MKQTIPLLACAALLSACADEQETANAPVSGEVVAEKLEDAAEQSEPAARDVLEDAADTARGEETMAPVHEPGSFAQEAMEEAGEATVEEDR